MSWPTKLAVAALAWTTGAFAKPGDGKKPGIEFVGKAPKFKVQLGGDNGKNATWMMITFGKIMEVMPDGKPVQKHSIMSLASENMTFVEEATTLYGVDVDVVTMKLNLDFDTADCTAGGGGPKRRLAEAGSVTIKTFIFTNDTEIPYDNYTVPVYAGQMKFNIESDNWPFCSEDNKLVVNMGVKTPGKEETGKPPKRKPGMKERGEKKMKPGMKMDAKKERMEKKRPKSKEFKADGGDGSMVAMDLPELALLDENATDLMIDLEDNGGKTNIKFTIPHFKSKMLYDPTVFEEEEETTATATSSGARALAWLAPFTLAFLKA